MNPRKRRRPTMKNKANTACVARIWIWLMIVVGGSGSHGATVRTDTKEQVEEFVRQRMIVRFGAVDPGARTCCRETKVYSLTKICGQAVSDVEAYYVDAFEHDGSVVGEAVLSMRESGIFLVSDPTSVQTVVDKAGVTCRSPAHLLELVDLHLRLTLRAPLDGAAPFQMCDVWQSRRNRCTEPEVVERDGKFVATVWVLPGKERSRLTTALLWQSTLSVAGEYSGQFIGPPPSPPWRGGD